MLDIVIPMYNAVEYSQRCVESIRRTLAVIPYRMHILNNGSRDGTAEWLATLRGNDLEILASRVNFGAPKGKNIILRYGNFSGNVMLFIDNDIEFRDDWYKPFFSLLDENPQAGVIGIDGFNITIGEYRNTHHQIFGHGPQPCDILRGCFMMARRDLVSRLGGFDEKCGMYWHDDDDFCVRAIGEGYQNYCIRTDKVIHHGSKSSSTTYPDVRDLSEAHKVQAYLAQKWRSLGLVGPDGRPKARTA